jgi:hypothetical protein
MVYAETVVACQAIVSGAESNLLMRTIVSYGFAGFCLALIASTALATAEDGGGGSGGHGGGGHSSDSPSAEGSSDSGGSGSGAAPGPPSAGAFGSSSGRGLVAFGDRDGDESVDADQDKARELVEHGVIRPLRDILARVRDQAPGDVVGVDLGRRGGRWVYGLKVLTPAGKRVEIAVDAGTMAILSARR